MAAQDKYGYTYLYDDYTKYSEAQKEKNLCRFNRIRTTPQFLLAIV